MTLFKSKKSKKVIRETIVLHAPIESKTCYSQDLK